MKSTFTYVRNVIIFLLCVYAVVGLLGLSANRIRALLNLPQQDFYIKNANLDLLQSLLMPSDFSDDFGWYSQHINGFERSASTFLGGYYNHYKLTIYYRVRRHEESPVLNTDSEIKFWGEPDALNNVRDLRKTGFANFQEVDCAFKMDDTVTCSMTIASANNVFDLEINYEKPGDIDGMVSILNQIIGIIEGKVEPN